MRPRTLLILALVVAALAAFIFWIERDLPSTERRAELAKRVVPVEAEEVTALVIERRGERVRLEREEKAGAGDEGDAADAADLGPGRWRLAEPLAARADGEAVDRLVRDLAALEREREVEGTERSEVGLEVPRARLTLETASATHTLEVGAEVPAGSSVVVAVDGGETLFVVPDRFWAEVDKEAGAWRDRSLFVSTRDEIQRVAVERPGAQRLLLARRGESFWIESPATDRADAEAVDGLLREITSARAARFVDEQEPDVAAMGLETPSAVVEVVVDGREEPWRLELGAPVDETGDRRFARVDGQLVELGGALATTLERDPGSWHSLALTDLQAYQIDEARVTDETGVLELERQTGDWLRDGETIPYTVASDLLYAVGDAKGSAVISPDEAASLALHPETAELTIELSGSEREATLRLWPAVEGRVPAGSDDRQWRVWLPEEAAASIRDKLAAVRAAEPEAAADSDADAAADAAAGAPPEEE